jgi:hypothetical protein
MSSAIFLDTDKRETPAVLLPASCDILSELNLPEIAIKRIRSVLDAGVQIDSAGLVVPRLDREILQKFTIDLLGVREVIREQLRLDKHVLYLPGSYDLVHVGHASFIQESIENYCAINKLSRENVLVLALADEDELISTVKKSASREGELPRPIQSLDLMGHLSAEVSPRLIDLASLPFVDLVGTLPAPPSFGSTVRNACFQSWLKVVKKDWAELLAKRQAPLEFCEAFGSLIDHLDPEKYGKICSAYRCEKNNINLLEKDHLSWKIQDWHFMLHQFPGDVSPGNSEKRFLRVISKNDTYADEVERSMSSCGIDTAIVEDTVVVSTSRLIAEFGWENLKDRKLGYLLDLYRQGVIPFSPQV